MSYSDYGGYAYRNGKRIIERSDVTITPDGDTYGSPGCYPLFAMVAAGMSPEEVKKRQYWPSGHAVLGDGPLYLVLRKQSASLYRGPVRIAEFEWSFVADDESSIIEDQRHDYHDSETKVLVEVVLRKEDNTYVYAKLIQPDGTLWHGWSGYGVGAGLEDCGYGYSTPARDRTLRRLWPESIKEGA